MKTKTSKKVLAAFLAALMVISVMPFTAFAATDGDLATLKQAITAYETKMDGTVYTNMADAYSKYIYAKELVDSYSYGDDTSLDLASAASQLTAATAEMGTWSAKTATNPAAADNSYSPSVLANGDTETGVLYTYGVSGSAPYTGSSKVNSSYAGVQFGSIVFMNDGTTNMTCPVNAYHKDTSWAARRMRSVVSTTAGITVIKDWQSNSNTDYGKNTVYQSQTSQEGWSSCTDNVDSPNGVAVDPGINMTWYYSSTIQYTGALSDTQYLVTVNPTTWKARDNSSNELTVSHTGATIYVVNYKPIISALAAAANTTVLKNVANYDEDSTDMLAYLNALGTAQGVDPTSYDYASNQATATASAASAIENAVTGISSKRNALNGSSTAYTELRDAITLAKATNKLGNASNTYTNDSWVAFQTAYQTAMDAINNVVNNGYLSTYNGTAIATIAANVQTTYDNLETTVTLANTEAMLTAIGNANTVLNSKSYLTTASANALQTAYNNALAGFTNNDYTLPTIFTEAQQASLDALTNALNTALDGIALDTATLSAKLNQAKAIDQAELLDPAALVKSINAATQALDTANSTKLTSDNVTAIVTDYQNAIDKIDAAIEYASHGYVEQANGVVSSGNAGVASTTYANGHDTVQFTYPTNVVIIKTKNESTSYNIGDFSLYVKDDGADYSQKIYELGISSSQLSAATSGAMTNGRFALTGFTNLGLNTKDGNESIQGGMYADGVALPSSYTAGLSDGNKSTYLWYKNGEFTTTSPMTFTADTLAYGLAPKTTSLTNGYSYVYAYGKYYSGTSTHTEEPTVCLATPTDVTLIDISPLVYYINNLCPTYVDKNAANDGKWYTAASYETFAEALGNAKILCNNGCINTYDTPALYGTAVTNAYNALKSAINGLKIATYTATFVYNTSASATTSSKLSGNYGTAIADTSIPAPASYVDGTYRYTFKGWDKDIEKVNGVNAIAGDVTYTAQYDESLNLADFSKLDIAVNTLKARTDKTYSVATLNAINAYIDNLVYYNYNSDQRAATYSDKQDEIATETSAIQNYITTLATIDTTAADAAIEKAKAENDSDAVDVSALQNAYVTVSVHGRDVVGINYADQAALDTAITAAIENLKPKTYTITLNGTTVGTFAYGTAITVMGDGTYVEGTTLAPGTGSDKYAWYYSFTSTQVTTSPELKYMLTSQSIGFVVKGNTTLTTKVQNKSETSYTITFKDSFGKVIDMRYTDAQGKFTMPQQPTYAFYTANGWSNGVASGAQATATADATIVANYSVKTTVPTYSVTVYNTAGEVATDTATSAEYNAASLNYNDEVTVTDPDAEIWVKYSAECYPELKDYSYVDENNFKEADVTTIAGNADAYTEAGLDPREGYEIIGFGDTLTFNVCEDVEIQSFALADFQSNYVPYAMDVCDSLGSFTYDKFTGNMKNPTATTDRNKYYKFTDYVYTISNCDSNLAASIIKDGIIKSDTKFSMIAQFAVPEGASVVESGILFTTASGKTLTLENASSDSTIKRLKSSQHTGSSTQYGQYVISILSNKLSGAYNFTYRSYCKYTLNGVNYTVYSDNAITESVNF